MENIVKINRILVIRNGEEFQWRNSTYILERGELGIAFWNVGDETKAIMKTGDGIHKWNDLKQNEYILEKDINLNHDFGKHKAVLGRVNAGGKGSSLSEWIFDALSELRMPNITQPQYEFTKVELIPDENNFEVGKKIAGIRWEGKYTDGKYEFGSRDNPNSQDAGIIPSFAVTFFAPDGQEIPVGQAESGEFLFSSDVIIEQEGEHSFGSIKMGYYWPGILNYALDSQGEVTETGFINNGSGMTEMPLSVTGYIEGLYCRAKTAEGNIDFRTKRKYSSGQIEYTIPVAAECVYLVWPASHNGIVDIYNLTAGANMNAVFDLNNPKEVEVNGIMYKYVSYTPAASYKNSAKLIITLE